jgi:hypothetical protein
LEKILKKRLQVGRLLGKLLQHEKTAQAVLKILIIFFLLYIPNNNKTHGKPI